MNAYQPPEINYPARWEYTVVGESQLLLERAIQSAAAGKDHSIQPSHVSKGGRYLSLRVTVLVINEGERLQVFAALKRHEAIRYVL